jgi:serine/threonine protein kinase
LAGRYRVLEKIGSGGMGEVYRAIDAQTQSTVAIKLLRTGAVRDLEHSTRMFEGALTANQIRHEHIVTIQDTGLCEFGPYVVMEDLRGENVGRLLERHGRLRPGQAMAIVEPVLLALGAAHASSLLHGDVKPQNVVVCQVKDRSYTVKLLDFGGAGSSGRPHFATTEYLSPEQAGTGTIDHRSDLFSVCVLMYELLTNTRPFHGPTPSSTTYRIINLPCPSLAESGLSHHDALSEVLLRGLEKDPARRYQTSRELLDALRRVVLREGAPNAVLGDLLPLSALARADSGSITIPPGAMTRASAPSLQGPDSSPRPAPASRGSFRPSGRMSLGRLDLNQAPNAIERDSPGPVLPSRYRGRYRVRAVIWQALDDYLRSRRPQSLRERLLSDLDSEEASDLLLGTLQGIVFCDLDTLTLYVETATERLFSGDPTWCRTAGREAVDGILSAALSRSIPPSLTPHATLRRICRIAGPLFDFGDWQASEGSDDTRAILTISGIEPVCAGLRWFCVGLVERALGVAYPNVALAVLRGEGPFMPRLVVEIAAS